jgi:predicted metal-dependent HD superfamily phosphohydrolase
VTVVHAALWRDAWAAVGVPTPASALRAELEARYGEPQRCYHTLQHLGECLDWFVRERAAAQRPGEVALALWFHDAIYDVHAHDNEARSADFARVALREAGASADAAQRVHALVMATRHNAQPADADAQLLVDIDLAILGAPAPRFDEYEQQICREYAHVPPALFAARRRQILVGFLARDPLYMTVGMRAHCEAQARINLRRVIG